VSAAVEKLKAAGSTVVEVQLPFWLVHFESDVQSLIIRTEAVPNLNAYLLSSFPPGYPRTHADIMAMSKRLTTPTADGMLPNPERLSLYVSEAATPPPTNPYYVAAKSQGLAFITASMDALLAVEHLDALVYPTSTRRIAKIGEEPPQNARGLYGNWGTSLASLTGWPDLTVPAGMTSDGLPVGISFMGPRFSDMKLLGFGYAFAQATHALRQPASTPPLPGDQFSY